MDSHMRTTRLLPFKRENISRARDSCDETLLSPTAKLTNQDLDAVTRARRQ